MTDPDYTARALDLLDTGCACHLRPPCDLCTALTDEHANIYRDHGAAALRTHIHATENGDEPPALPDDRSETVCIITRPATPDPWTPPPRPEPTPRELAVRAIAARFRWNDPIYEETPARWAGPNRVVAAHRRRKASATDPVTGTTIESRSWHVGVDDGDSECELVGRILKWAEKQVPT